MKKSNSYSPEVRERAVRMVLENLKDYPSEWAAIESIAPKIGCVPQTLHGWIRKHQTDIGHRPGQTTEERERIKALERENRELRKANEILRLGKLQSSSLNVFQIRHLCLPRNLLNGREFFGRSPNDR